MKTGNYLLFFLLFFLLTCKSETHMMTYKPLHLTETMTVNADWNKDAWKMAEEARLTHYMGKKPDHFPDTRFKVAWDDSAIYVIFRVEDRYVRAVTSSHNGPVYKDSCVEFFFIPEEGTGNGYFNLEMNCGGTMLFFHQTAPRQGAVPVREDLADRIDVAATLPRVVDPEIMQDTTWIVEYRIPFSILKEYHDFETPRKGTHWRANFYKCGDDTSHPHWLTWSPVMNPTPDFHLPAYFGLIQF